MSRRYMHLRGLAQTADIRTATFEGNKHIVVPVIALIGDTVVRPMQSTGPEFVPSSELAVVPEGWNGRPVLSNHPDEGRSSANDPVTLETLAFGRLFNTKFEDGKLKTEAWLSISQASKVGEDAEDVVSKVQSGEVVEVSVGAWITAEESSGTAPDGSEYEFIWRDIVPDHLAIGLGGAEGACSVDMGCGAPRSNKGITSNTGTSTDSTNIVPNTTKVLRAAENSMKVSGLVKLLEKLGIRSAAEHEDGTSDSELRDSLTKALRENVPGFDWITDVFPETNVVIYMTFIEDIQWFRQSFSVNEESEVTLSDDKEEVVPVTRFEPLSAHAECECEGNTCTCKVTMDEVVGAEGSESNDNNTGDDMSKIKELVAALIDNEDTPFSAKDSELLEAFSEERITELSDSFGESNTETIVETETSNTPTVEVDTTATPTVPAKRTDEEWLSDAPESVKSLVARSQSEEAERRVALISSLTSLTKDVYTEDDLKSKSTDDLKSLVTLLKVDDPTPNFIGRGLVTPVDTTIVDPPPSLTERIKAHRATN